MQGRKKNESRKGERKITGEIVMNYFIIATGQSRAT